MPRIKLTFEAMGYRDVEGRFTRRTKKLQEERRSLIRDAGRKVLDALKRHANRDTGLFAEGLFFRTYDRGHQAEARFYAGGEHAFVLPFLIEGTRPHLIPRGGAAEMLAKGYPLRFYWEKGPAGPGIYYFWEVHHPGTKPSPFVDDARAEVEPGLFDDLRQVAIRVAWL